MAEIKELVVASKVAKVLHDGIIRVQIKVQPHCPVGVESGHDIEVAPDAIKVALLFAVGCGDVTVEREADNLRNFTQDFYCTSSITSHLPIFQFHGELTRFAQSFI